eukprot:CAMPEP_0196806644 /NCGR_PEP_ID=MMETSP1362-20130617/6557_1 /TAXON_ID=163516 /ORGANISM="Leptocylindrus danicus, Strain CCMP1856" /LENGTH=1237 /DNA_ID=CAMNT_0042180223 /DNA_START=49 /DNA_END=3759 /DNA_ORIENTATION=-
MASRFDWEDDKRSAFVYIKDVNFGWIPARIAEDDSNYTSFRRSKVIAETKFEDADEVADEEAAIEAPGTVKVITQEPVAWSESTSTAKRKFEFGETVEVVLKDYKDCELPMQNVAASGLLEHQPDMSDLAFLHEAAVLYNLKERHRLGMPYTKVSEILVAMNPFRWIDGLYSKELLMAYASMIIWRDSEENMSENEKAKRESIKLRNGFFGGLEPHVFETSCKAYKGLAVDGVNQSILVSGESGAGKTETVKILMSNLANIGQNRDAEPQDLKSKSDDIVDEVLSSNFIFEAFGNAKTVRNDNSSRFSKFTQLQYDVEENMGVGVPSCKLVGSFTQTYVLEKSRVVEHSFKERNFHIFYQLIQADDEYKSLIWDGLSDSTIDSFKYVGYTNVDTIGGTHDSEKAEETVKALAEVGIVDEKLRVLMRAVCCVLQLGNIALEQDPDDADKSVITSLEELEKLSELMGIPSDSITEALTSRSVKARNEVFTVPLKKEDAIYSRDALAKGIYANIFDYLVEQVNEATRAPDIEDKSFGTISLLDIFGFEHFDVNRFEQLCINYANEKLQLKYTQDNFRVVKEEYESEGIELIDFTGVDNPEVLDLMESKLGLIVVLNEECVRPNATPNTFVKKLKRINRRLGCLVQERLAPPEEFGIKHYAADVTYDARNFIVRNKDALADDLVTCAAQSTNMVISQQSKKLIAGGKGKTFKGQQRGWLVAATVLGKFQTQLKQLMGILEKTKTRYVRCIKPNSSFTPGATDHGETLVQLKSAGLVAALAVSREYFPNRLPHDAAIQRFMPLVRPMGLLRSEAESDKSYIERILQELLKDFKIKKRGIDNRIFACGKTRVYFRGGSLEYLETERQRVFTGSSICLQSFARYVIWRCRFCAWKKSAIKVQSMVRCQKHRKAFLLKRNACISIQTAVRVMVARMEFIRLRRDRAARRIQSRWRCKTTMWDFFSMMDAAKTIQRFFRNRLAKEDLTAAMAVVVEDARHQKKIETVLGDIEKYIDQSKENNEDQDILERSAESLNFAQKQLYSLRAKSDMLRSENMVLNEKLMEQTKNATNSNMRTSALRLDSEALQRKAEKLQKLLEEEKKKNSDYKKQNKAMSLTLLEASKKINEDKEKIATQHDLELQSLKGEVEAKDAAHAKEIAELTRKFEAKLDAANNEIADLKKSIDDDYDDFTVVREALFDNAGTTRNRASITADSGELGALRDEVMQMKMEYEQNAMDQEAKFAEW